jgi:hypothetical protein
MSITLAAAVEYAIFTVRKVGANVGKRAMEAKTASAKKTYQSPSLKALGKVADLTRTGLTNPGGDGKEGSVASMGV